MSSAPPTPSLLDWFARQAGFPHRRLPERAELLLCFAATAAQDEAGAAGVGAAGGPIVRKDAAADAALRQHALRRSRVHYKCDNSAKV